MKKIAGYRIMLGLSQDDIAKQLNISRQSYSEKERGNISFKDSEKLYLKNLFLQIDDNITIDYLFFS